MEPEKTKITRAWLLEHGWEVAENIPFFHGDRETISTDLCVFINRKEYLMARFHFMGDDALLPEAEPSSIEVFGVNNNVEMLDVTLADLISAVHICRLNGFCDVDIAIGGVYDISYTRRKEDPKREYAQVK